MFDENGIWHPDITQFPMTGPFAGLSIMNQFQSQKIAQEHQSDQALRSHLLQLTDQEQTKRQQDQDQFEQWVQEHPQAPAEDIARKGLSLGVNVPQLTNLWGRDISGGYGLEKSNISAGARIGSAEIGAGARLGAAQLGAGMPQTVGPTAGAEAPGPGSVPFARAGLLNSQAQMDQARLQYYLARVKEMDVLDDAKLKQILANTELEKVRQGLIRTQSELILAEMNGAVKPEQKAKALEAAGQFQAAIVKYTALAQGEGIDSTKKAELKQAIAVLQERVDALTQVGNSPTAVETLTNAGAAGAPFGPVASQDHGPKVQPSPFNPAVQEPNSSPPVDFHTVDEVKAAYKAKEISLEEATRVIRDQFGGKF